MLTRRELLKYSSINVVAAPFLIQSARANATKPTSIPMMSQETLNNLTSGAPKKRIVPYGVGFDDTWGGPPDMLRRAAIAKYAQEITDGNCSGIGAVQEKQGVMNTARFDRAVQFARENKLRIKSCNLIWEGSEPKWTKNMTSFIEAEKLMKGHIEYMMRRYKGQVYNWVVVNEPMSMEPKSIHDFRPSTFQKTMGENHIAECYKLAYQVDPTAKLMINEYAIEATDATSKIKRDGFRRIIFNLLDRGVPLHGVGIQGHLSDEHVIDKEALSRFCEEMKKANLEVYVTELDVLDLNIIGTHDERDRMVAQRGYDFLRAIYDVVTPASVTTWGIVDYETWFKMYAKRKDGLPFRPLPLDDNFQPKPFMKVIEHFTKGYY